VFIEDGTASLSSLWDRVGPRYFDTIGTPVVRGRGIDEHDTPDSQHVAVVNETFARLYLPGRDPIGRHFGKYERPHAADYQIVGVVQDAKYQDASREVRPMFFVPLSQTIRYAGTVTNMIEESSRYVGSIELHVHGDPDAFAPVAREALGHIDPNLPAVSIRSFPELIRITTSERTLIARLSLAFGAIALVLAAVGLYGVTAYRVARRTREIGLRMALGASRSDVAALVIRGALSQTVAGLLAGVPLALLAARALRNQLFGVSPFNVAVLTLAGAVVCGCALLASALPARRATAISPMDALRTE
jgi:predicted permease